jgi:predicted kinase
MGTLFIPVGIPGSGKSTWAREVLPDAAVVSSDEIRKEFFGSLVAAHDEETKARNNAAVFLEFHRRIVVNLADGFDVLADATNLNHEARTKLRTIAGLVGARTHVLFFKNIVQAVERNFARDEDAVVPEAAMEYMMEKYWDTLDRLPSENYDRVTAIASVG